MLLHVIAKGLKEYCFLPLIVTPLQCIKLAIFKMYRAIFVRSTVHVEFPQEKVWYFLIGLFPLLVLYLDVKIQACFKLKESSLYSSQFWAMWAMQLVRFEFSGISFFYVYGVLIILFFLLLGWLSYVHCHTSLGECDLKILLWF